jgi:hypothetical protein
VVGGKILFSLETALNSGSGEIRGLSTRSLRSSSGTLTVKRLTDGSGARNVFGLKGRVVNSIAELLGWMEGFGWLAAALENGKRPVCPRISPHFLTR